MNLHINLHFVKNIITNSKHLIKKQHFPTPQSSSLNKRKLKKNSLSLKPLNIVFCDKLYLTDNHQNYPLSKKEVLSSPPGAQGKMFLSANTR